MITQPSRRAIVIDTGVYDANIVPSKLAAAYQPLIVGRLAFISFQTAAELRLRRAASRLEEGRIRGLR